MNLLKGCVLFVAHKVKGGTLIRTKWLPGHRWERRVWSGEVRARSVHRDGKRYALVTCPLPELAFDLPSVVQIGAEKYTVVAARKGTIEIENPPVRKRRLEIEYETLWDQEGIVNPYDAMRDHGIEFRGGTA